MHVIIIQLFPQNCSLLNRPGDHVHSVKCQSADELVKFALRIWASRDLCLRGSGERSSAGLFVTFAWHMLPLSKMHWPITHDWIPCRAGLGSREMMRITTWNKWYYLTVSWSLVETQGGFSGQDCVYYWTTNFISFLPSRHKCTVMWNDVPVPFSTDISDAITLSEICRWQTFLI